MNLIKIDVDNEYVGDVMDLGNEIYENICRYVCDIDEVDIDDVGDVKVIVRDVGDVDDVCDVDEMKLL